METWKKIPDCTGYEISNCGRIRSYKKRNSLGGWSISKHPQRILKQSVTNKGYLFVRIMQNKTPRTRRVADLALLTFVGKKPPLLEVCHNDGNKTNNHLSNLRYDTHWSNMQDKVKHCRVGRFDQSQILYIRIQVANKKSTLKDLAVSFCVTESTIRKICKGKTYTNYPGPITKKLPRQYKQHTPSHKQTSQYRGVYKYKKGNVYKATIWIGGRGGKPLWLGSFDLEIDAAKAYDEKAKELHGAFAILNFPDK